MSAVEIKNLVKKYGSTEVVHAISAAVDDGEFVVIVGPSGCGKSTLLRMIAGLEEVSDGEIVIDGQVVNRVEPKDRGIAMVFQNYALYPHMTVAKNMAYGLKLRGVPKAERKRRVAAAAEMLELSAVLKRKPRELSGGQRQRVAMGRAIVRQPKVFLFDEPLSNLDAKLRHQMRVELKKLHEQIGATMIYVTHDQVEAMTLADKIIVMNGGHIEQIGTPEEIYHNPASRFVAGFIGSPPMNFLPLTEVPGKEFVLEKRTICAAAEEPSGRAVVAGIRPEKIRLHRKKEPGTVKVKIDFQEKLGANDLLYATIKGWQVIVSTTDAGAGWSETCWLEFPPKALYFFDGTTGKRAE